MFIVNFDGVFLYHKDKNNIGKNVLSFNKTPNMKKLISKLNI